MRGRSRTIDTFDDECPEIPAESRSDVRAGEADPEPRLSQEGALQPSNRHCVPLFCGPTGPRAIGVKPYVAAELRPGPVGDRIEPSSQGSYPPNDGVAVGKPMQEETSDATSFQWTSTRAPVPPKTPEEPPFLSEGASHAIREMKPCAKPKMSEDEGAEDDEPRMEDERASRFQRNLTYRASVFSDTKYVTAWDGAARWFSRTCCRCFGRRRPLTPTTLPTEDPWSCGTRSSRSSVSSTSSGHRTFSWPGSAAAMFGSDKCQPTLSPAQAALHRPGRRARRAQEEKKNDFSKMYDWKGKHMQHPQPQVRQILRVYCGVWNLAGLGLDSESCDSWVRQEPRHHIYAVGFCEGKAGCTDEVRSFLGEDYHLVAEEVMSGIQVAVFAWKGVSEYVWDVRQGQVPTGVANLLGNKGGTQIGFRLGKTKMLFICCHLAAGEGNKMMRARTENLERILLDSPLRRTTEGLGLQEEYDRVFLMGDLNTRVEAGRAEVEAWLAQDRLDECLARDQLLPLMAGRMAARQGQEAKDPKENSEVSMPGLWPLFTEAPIGFPPTYKYDAGTVMYDTSPKQRVPSWTDRVLWRRCPHIVPVSYSAVMSLVFSDHRPIFAQFEVEVNLQPDSQGDDVKSGAIKTSSPRGPKSFFSRAKETPEAHTVVFGSAVDRNSPTGKPTEKRSVAITSI